MRPRQQINVPFTQNDIMRKNGNTKKSFLYILPFALFSHFLYINLTTKMVLTFPSQVTECLHHHKSTTKWHSVPYEKLSKQSSNFLLDNSSEICMISEMHSFKEMTIMFWKFQLKHPVCISWWPSPYGNVLAIYTAYNSLY